MSDEHVGEARRRLLDLAARAVAAAKTATSATAVTAARAVATANTAAARAAAAAASATGRVSAPADEDTPDDAGEEATAGLEQELAAERARTAELEAALKALEFKFDVLERSYGKQLAESRAAGDAARQELSETQARLAETVHELKEVTAVRDRLRDMFAFDGRRVPPELRERRPGDEDTIARLMSVPSAIREEDAHSGRSPEHSAGEPEAAELLSPDLVFDSSVDGEDADDDRPPARR